MDLNSLSRKAEKNQRDSQRVVDNKLKGSKALGITLVFKILLGVECTKMMITIKINRYHGWSLLLGLDRVKVGEYL